MRTQARAVIIGGGIGGVSTLYHLTREGWTDVVLVERDELTSGSTWHAAAQVTRFGLNQTLVALKQYSVNLYRELAADPAHPIDYHITGGTRLAHTQDEVDAYRHLSGMAATMGVDLEYIDAQELGRRHPLICIDGILGAWWDREDGDCDPNQLVAALARRARAAGAEIQRFNPVENITRLSNGEFLVHTKNGDINCEIVVNASGYRVNEVGAMLGVSHPVTSMEHMYFLTEPVMALRELDSRLPILRDTQADFYCRQEKDGLLVGIYEQACKTFGMDGVDPMFTRALCPSDLDRCLDNVDQIFERLPCLQETGIRSVVCGPITYTPDGAAILGPIPGVRNAYACLGLRTGIGDGGGHGKALAQIIVHGACEWDTWFMDPRRFQRYANTEFTCVKAVEDYRHEFHYHRPHEFRPEGRLARTTPLYLAIDELDPEWAVVNGWERPLYFKPSADFEPEHSYRFTNVDAVVGQEVAAVATGCGIIELSGFTRFEIRGPGAAAFLDHMICGRLPQTDGKVGLAYLLQDDGNILSEATLARLGEDHFWYGSAAASEWHDRDWLQAHKPDGVKLTEMVSTHTTLVIAGPNARALLQIVSPRCDCSKQAFPWLRIRTMFVGYAEVIAMSVSFSGEQAFELHVPNEQLLMVWRSLMQAGKQFGLTPYGNLALESMRLEKGYLHWKADLITERGPFETGLARFVDLQKPDFIGREAMARRAGKQPAQQLAVMTIECDLAPPQPGCPIYDGNALIGSVTSAGYGHRVKANIAYGFIDYACCDPGTVLDVEILGERFPATVVEPCLYDPANSRLR